MTEMDSGIFAAEDIAADPTSAEIQYFLIHLLRDQTEFPVIVRESARRYHLSLFLLDINYRIRQMYSGDFSYDVGDSEATVREKAEERIDEMRESWERQIFLMYRNGTPFTITLSEEYKISVHALYSENGPEGILAVLSSSDQSDMATALGSSLTLLYRYLFRGKTNLLVPEPDLFRTVIARELLSDGQEARNSFLRLASPSADRRTDEDELWRIEDPSHSGRICELRPGYLMIVFTRESNGDPESACLELMARVPNSFVLVEENGIRALFYQMEGSDLQEASSFLTRIRNISGKYHLRAGISSLFFRLHDRFDYCRQAEAALAAACGHSENPVVLADDWYTQILHAEVVRGMGADTFLISEVKRLQQYDRKNHTEYCRTLHTYLQYGGRFTPAAEAMFIDRGTLQYRLKKIRRIIRLDFDQPQNAEYLLCGFQAGAQIASDSRSNTDLR